MKVGLYFGTFNPIHNGHVAIAEYMANETDLDEVWLVVSPQNPLKRTDELVSDRQRLEMVELVTKDNPKLHPSDVEFTLPIPSYTLTTLLHVDAQHPDTEFVLIIGEDNLRNFEQWHRHEEIVRGFSIYVYPRSEINAEGPPSPIWKNGNIKLYRAPLLDVSSTLVRQCIAQGESFQTLVPQPVHDHIRSHGFYTQ